MPIDMLLNACSKEKQPVAEKRFITVIEIGAKKSSSEQRQLNVSASGGGGVESTAQQLGQKRKSDTAVSDPFFLQRK